MTVEGWIFMVGLRVVDLGALIAWMIWFYKQCDKDDEDSDGDDFRRPGDPDDRDDQPPAPSSGGGLDIPLPDAAPWPTRRRDHGGDLAPLPRPARRQPAEPRREPRRVPVET